MAAPIEDQQRVYGMGAVVWIVVIPVLLLAGIFLKSYIIDLSSPAKSKSTGPKPQNGQPRQYSQGAREALAQSSLSREQVEEVITRGEPSKGAQGIRYRYQLAGGNTVIVVLGKNGEVQQIWE